MLSRVTRWATITTSTSTSTSLLRSTAAALPLPFLRTARPTTLLSSSRLLHTSLASHLPRKASAAASKTATTTTTTTMTTTNNNSANNATAVPVPVHPHVHSSACNHDHPADEHARMQEAVVDAVLNGAPTTTTTTTATTATASTSSSAVSSPKSSSRTHDFKSPSPSSYRSLEPVPSLDPNTELNHLFENNRIWAKKVEQQYPGFFAALSNQQKPKYMWIGCSDSRVPASEITGLMPGEVFVHRNVANCVVHTDLNVLSVLQIAVDVLKVEHIIVCGHYGCAGVKYALLPAQIGVADNWIRNIKDVARAHADKLAEVKTLEEKTTMLCEFNVLAQVENVVHTAIVQNAWRRGQPLAVHGWIYGVGNGLLKNLVEPSIKGFDQISPAFHLEGPQTF